MPRVTLSKDSLPPGVSLLPSMNVQAWMVTALSAVAASASAAAISAASLVASQDAFGTSCNVATHALAVASLSGSSSFTL